MNKMIKPGMIKYCVVGNIKRDSCLDENGILRYGTKYMMIENYIKTSTYGRFPKWMFFRKGNKTN